MRVAVLGAGGPAGVNTLRALDVAGHDCIAVDSKPEHLIWCEPYAETMQSGDDFWALAPELDLILAQPDSLVLQLANWPGLRTFQPTKTTIHRCQDKHFAARTWASAGLLGRPPQRITTPWPDYLHLANDAFGLPYWLRATQGAGAKGAILVRSLEQAYHWLRFWETRGAEVSWMAEEFLPGRDLAWASIWCQGELVTSFTRERLEYLYPHLSPEGLTGTPTAARVVCDETVNAVAYAAVASIDPRPHGIYSVDLREDSEGVPRPTEINAGRGFTTLGLWSLHGPNFLDIAVRLATGGALDELPKYDALPEGLTLYRHIDCGHIFQYTTNLVAA